MLNTTLLDILRSFSPDEIKKFDDFVRSPYFNKKTAEINFYKQIKKYAPGFLSPRLKKEKIWSALYPGKEFHYGVLKNLIFDLTHLAEKFITIEYSQRENFWDNIELSYNFLDSLNEREIKNLFKSKSQTIRKHFDELQKRKEIPAEVYFYHMQKIYLLKFGHSNQFDRHSHMSDELKEHTNFRTALILYYIFHNVINHINFSRDYVCNKNDNILMAFLKNADNKNLIFELIESLKPHSAEMYNIMNAYYKYYRSVSDSSSVEKYFDFKNTLSTNSENFSKTDLHILYSGLRAAAVKLSSLDISKSKEYLDIVKIKIRDSVMLNPDGFMTEGEFTSCLQAACDLGDSEFIRDFAERFLKYLPKENRKNMEQFYLAHLFFTENEFVRSLKIIHTIHHDFSGMKFYLRNLQMMNYYELNDHNSFLLSLDSYKHFIKNNKDITEEWKAEQVSFNIILTQLFKLKIKSDEYKLKNIKMEINSSLVPKKQWLLRKAGELGIRN